MMTGFAVSGHLVLVTTEFFRRCQRSSDVTQHTGDLTAVFMIVWSTPIRGGFHRDADPPPPGRHRQLPRWPLQRAVTGSTHELHSQAHRSHGYRSTRHSIAVPRTTAAPLPTVRPRVGTRPRTRRRGHQPPQGPSPRLRCQSAAIRWLLRLAGAVGGGLSSDRWAGTPGYRRRSEAQFVRPGGCRDAHRG